MWEQAKAEMDAIFKKNNKIMVERRHNGNWSQFSNHLEFIQSFAALQSRVIRPAMMNFGSYVERMGHRHYIETAERLIDGYLLPTSNITLHLLLNQPRDTKQGASHALTFKTDSIGVVCLYGKTGSFGAEGSSTTSRYPVARYELRQLTPDLVESHLKDFVIQAILTT